MTPTIRSVLIVDDDAPLREAIAEALSDEGLSVSCSANGRDALAALRSGARPDVILLDLMMPVMDGWTFREEQSRDPSLATIPVVVVTAAHDLPKPIDARAIVRKPFRLQLLLSAIHIS
jgi:CheY-like chemotaxis protein